MALLPQKVYPHGFVGAPRVSWLGIAVGYGTVVAEAGLSPVGEGVQAHLPDTCASGVPEPLSAALRPRSRLPEWRSGLIEKVPLTT